MLDSLDRGGMTWKALDREVPTWHYKGRTENEKVMEFTETALGADNSCPDVVSVAGVLHLVDRNTTSPRCTASSGLFSIQADMAAGSLCGSAAQAAAEGRDG